MIESTDLEGRVISFILKDRDDIAKIKVHLAEYLSKYGDTGFIKELIQSINNKTDLAGIHRVLKEYNEGKVRVLQRGPRQFGEGKISMLHSAIANFDSVIFSLIDQPKFKTDQNHTLPKINKSSKF
jgi:hypothetical protein